MKDDPIDKVSEICIKTLNLLEEGDTDKNSDNDDNNFKKSINNNNLKNINVSQKISKENNKDKITKKKNVEDKKEDIQKSINKKEKEKENYKNINNININDNFAIKNKIDYKNNNNMQTIEINIKNKDLNEKYGKSLNEILAQMKIIQETQNFLNNSLEQIRYKIDKNYSNLNSRKKLKNSLLYV